MPDPPTGRVSLRFKKGRDGPSTLAIVRPDGSAAVQRVPDAFPVHDLTHYSVESVLRLQGSFLSLMGNGWEFADFGAPWPRGPLPAEAAWTEEVVGLFWQERWPNGIFRTLEELNQAVGVIAGKFREARSSHGTADPALLARRLTEPEVEEVRRLLGALIARWHALEAGETLVLPFPPEG
jgi:hypothetical protein